MKRLSLMACAMSLTLACNLATAAALEVEVKAGAAAREQTPVRVALTSELPAGPAELTGADGTKIVGQVTKPGLLAAEGTKAELHFVLPQLAAGESRSYTVKAPAPASGEGFSWKDTPGEHLELSFGARPVLRYMYTPLDEARREETYKVFHHVYDPLGERIVTKGAGGQFTHHRGLFYGFNKVTFEKNGIKTNCDIWHCRGASQQHKEVLSAETGPVVGRHRVAINWMGPDNRPFAVEHRELTVYHRPGGNLIEFASRLVPLVDAITLDGDPQHAGFHFRADNEVSAKTAKQTYYLRPDGPGKPGETRNWPGNKDHVNLPWNAMSFVLGEQRYTACYLDRPGNPKESRFSERDYGRFGSYFEARVTPEEPLDVNYRVWLQEGETTVDGVRALNTDFVDPPQAAVK